MQLKKLEPTLKVIKPFLAKNTKLKLNIRVFKVKESSKIQYSIKCNKKI